MPGSSHMKAAQAHEQAAETHRSAAKSHEAGDHKAGLAKSETATKQSADASTCCGTAHNASKHAMK